MSIVTVISILRLVWLYETALLSPKYDANYDIRVTYSSFKTGLAIISASCPALRGLLIQWFPQLFAYSKTYGTGTSGQNRRHQYHDGGQYYGRSSTAARTDASSFHNSTKTKRSTISQYFAMKDMRQTRFEVRAHSPSVSEEEMMALDGMRKTTEIQMQRSE
ncbi:hypothetical protein PG991_003058 [Apiospora marii]|uniref:Uncharacterized protein n=1 Tax=Apiospora marii TaxID=335849 RepID=A0ABR1SH43_9PEZI